MMASHAGFLPRLLTHSQLNASLRSRLLRIPIFSLSKKNQVLVSVCLNMFLKSLFFFAPQRIEVAEFSDLRSNSCVNYAKNVREASFHDDVASQLSPKVIVLPFIVYTMYFALYK